MLGEICTLLIRALRVNLVNNSSTRQNFTRTIHNGAYNNFRASKNDFTRNSDAS